MTSDYENDDIPERAFRAGHNTQGQPLYVIKANYSNARAIGKLLSSGYSAIPYDGQAVTVSSYDVLVNASDQDVSMPSMKWVAAENGILPCGAIEAGLCL